MAARLVVISGPSGVGKTSVAGRLLADSRFARAVTATTRAPRPGEADGRDYQFLPHAAFAARLQAGGFLAPAVVYGEHYGTPRENVERILGSGRHCLLVIDVQGVEDLRSRGVEALYVFVEAPSLDEAARRLRAREGTGPERLAVRIEQARVEMQRKSLFNHILVNDEIERAARELAGWVGIDLA